MSKHRRSTDAHDGFARSAAPAACRLPRAKCTPHFSPEFVGQSIPHRQDLFAVAAPRHVEEDEPALTIPPTTSTVLRHGPGKSVVAHLLGDEHRAATNARRHGTKGQRGPRGAGAEEQGGTAEYTNLGWKEPAGASISASNRSTPSLRPSISRRERCLRLVANCPTTVGPKQRSQMPGFHRDSRLAVDLVKLEEVKEARGEGAERYGPPQSPAARTCSQLGWVDARLEVYGSMHPGRQRAQLEERAASALAATLGQWRDVGAQEHELSRTRARAASLPTVEKSLLKRHPALQLQHRQEVVLQELSKCRQDRAAARAKSARDLLKQGRGELGARRLPMSEGERHSEPFVHHAILRAATRASLQMFQLSRTARGAPRRGDTLHAPLPVEAKTPMVPKHERADELAMDKGSLCSEFRGLLREVALADWHDDVAEQTAGLAGLPCLNHEVLPMLCCNPLEPQGLKLQAKIPSTAIFHGGICTSFIENNALDNLVLKYEHDGEIAEALAVHFQLIAPARKWSMIHGSFIAKRLHVNGDGQRLQYVAPTCGRAVCFRECVRAIPLHCASTLGTFSSSAIPPTENDLEELLKGLSYVEPATVTTIQRFIPSHGNRAQVLRVIRQRSGEQRRFLLSNRYGYLQNTSKDLTTEDAAEARLAIAIEHANSKHVVDIQELSSVDSAGGTQKSGKDDRSQVHVQRRAELEAQWADAAVVVNQIFEIMCLRGARGAAVLRSLVNARRQTQTSADAGVGVLTPGDRSRKAKSQDTAGANVGAVAVAQDAPLVPVLIAVDLMRDAQGRLVLLQVKDLVWGPAKG